MNLIKNNNFSVDVVPGKIEVVGFEKIKEGVSELIKKYDGLIVGPDQVKDVKKELANLNKVAKAIDDKRKEIKKEFEKPLKEFEAQIKELVIEIKEVRSNLDMQVKKYEEERKNEIKKVIENYLNDLYELNNIPEGFRNISVDEFVKLTAVSASGNVTKQTALAIESEINKLLLKIKEAEEEKLKKQLEIEKIKKEAVEEFVSKKKEKSDKIEEVKESEDKIIFEIVYKVKAPTSISKDELVAKVFPLIKEEKIKPEVRRAK